MTPEFPVRATNAVVVPMTFERLVFLMRESADAEIRRLRVVNEWLRLTLADKPKAKAATA